MNTLTVVNIKCGGCEKKITSSLEKAGLTNIAVDAPKQTVAFEGDVEAARRTLDKLGYPEVGTPAAKSVLKKGRSYVACAMGRME